MVTDSALHSLKGDLCNALWPTYQGCLYGRSCRASHVKARYDAQLDALLSHFGAERLAALAIEVHARITHEMGRPPRTFLGHMDRLQQLMLQEEQSGPADPAVVGAIDRHAQAQVQSHADWAQAGLRFDALPQEERDRLIDQARRSSRVLASRPADSPIIRAAAIALFRSTQEVHHAP